LVNDADNVGAVQNEGEAIQGLFLVRY
jgi:hypothetical protein